MRSSCIANLVEKNGSGSCASSKERRGHAVEVNVSLEIQISPSSDLLECTEMQRNRQSVAAAGRDQKDRELSQSKKPVSLKKRGLEEEK